MSSDYKHDLCRWFKSIFNYCGQQYEHKTIKISFLFVINKIQTHYDMADITPLRCTAGVRASFESQPIQLFNLFSYIINPIQNLS